MKGKTDHLRFATRAIHAGQPPEPVTGAVSTPIFQTSTYVFEEFGKSTGYDYARSQNPTREALEACVASLEGGASGVAFGSGMGAISAILSYVRTGERVVASRTVYGGTYRYFSRVLDKTGIEFVWVDATDLAAVEAAMTPNTKLLYVETPTNPLMEITDLAAAAEIAHRHGALLVVDNTFLSPYFQRPLEHGADLVFHSSTKYLGGHSDVIGGVVVTARPEDGEWLHFVQKSAGAIPGPFDCFLVMRGIKTLAVRMPRHEENAHRLVEFLTQHPKVRRVLYPGLPDHPGHAIHQRQASGFGAMITFDLGSLEAARSFLNGLELMYLAESLGGVETLISHPASMTHASVPPEVRAATGITDGLVRISAGIEDIGDLLADCEQGLAAIRS